MGWNRLRAVMAIAAPVLAAGVLAAPAGAITTITVLGSGTQAPNAVATATALCTGPRHLVGGGHALYPTYDPILDTGAQSLVQQTFPGSRDALKVRSFATAGGSDSTLFSVGLCRKGTFTRPSTPYAIAAATHLAARVKCPQNRHVIGGGYSVISPYDPLTATGANVSIHTSRRINDQVWLVGATRDYGEEATVVAHAFCEWDFRGPVTAARGSIPAEDEGAHTAVAECPDGTGVVSGGFKARPLGTPGNAMSTGLYPWISINAPLPRRTGWVARIHNGTGPLPGATLTAFAYCKAL